MKILFKNATLINEKSPFHNQKKDVLVIDGLLTQIEDQIKVEDAIVIDKKDLHLSSGWFDPCVSFGEPGYEERETLANGLLTAAKSGFTHIVLNPDTHPALDSLTDVSHLLQQSQGSTTALHISASLSEASRGENLAPLFEMHKAGAIAFGDFNTTLKNPNLLRIALDYVQSFDGLIQAYPLDSNLSNGGQMHEGEVSTNLGLKAIPHIAETSTLARDIQLLEYTQGRMHIPYISTAESVELIRNAKKKGLKISCGVAVAHLHATEEDLMDFDANFKIIPPLRSSKDQRALREGLLDGTIDMVTSLHQPLNPELKDLEFVRAKEGSIGIEASFGILLNYFPLVKVISFLTRGKKAFKIKDSGFELDETADFTLFSPKGSSTLEKSDLHSTSKNCLFLGSTIKGKVYGSLRGNTLQLNN
jgi:dihydroorotase